MGVTLVVNNLAKYRSREVIEGIEKLLEAAKRGDVRSIAYIAEVGPGDNRAKVLGAFRHRPGAALQATFQLERMLRDEDDELLRTT